MRTEFNSKTRFLAGVAAASLMAGTAFADTTNVSDSSRAAEDMGVVQDNGSTNMSSETTGGTVVSPDKPRIADDAPSAADIADRKDGEKMTVDTQTEPGVATGPRSKVAVGDPAMSDWTVDDLVGKNVLSATGKDVGEIDYVILHDGEVAGVVGVGGFLGIGEHDVAIPLSQFDVTANGELQLDSRTEAELRNMPEVDEDGISPLEGDTVVGNLS